MGITDSRTTLGPVGVGRRQQILDKDIREMREMWMEAERLVNETGYKIDEDDDDKYTVFNATGSKWSGIHILGRTMARTTHMTNSHTRIMAAKNAFNGMRQFLTRTRSPGRPLGAACEHFTAVGPAATWGATAHGVK